LKVLLDENVPHRLRRLIVNHEVITVDHLGWSGLKNGQLMAAADTEGFQVFVTGDKNIPHQQNLANYPLGIVMLPTVDWTVLKGCVPQTQQAVDQAEVGSIRFVACGNQRMAPGPEV
jgi:predicted nuclease of predicted toxin-antitoxin system